MKIDLEKILILIFFTIILFLGPGILFDHSLKHDFPFGYGASDAFQHQVRAEAIKDAGNFRYEAIYISKGFENVVGRYPPVLYHLAVVFSHASGMEVYDSIYFIVLFFPIVAILILHFIIKNFNKTVALLSLPLTMLIFSTPPAAGFLWGHWPSVLSQTFLIAFFWGIAQINLNRSYIIIALFMSAMALTHMPPFIFSILFLALFFGMKMLSKNLDKTEIKKLLLAFILFFVISSYYLVIFLNTWAKAQPYSFSIFPIWEGNPGFYLGGFGLLLIPMVIGFLYALLKLRGLHVPLLFGTAMLLSGFLNYAGFEVRSFQVRFFWPLYLSIFFGLGVYIIPKFLLKKLNKNWNLLYTSIIFALFLVIFTGIVGFPALKQTDAQRIPYIPYVNTNPGSGIMNPFHWESLKWISKNTPKDAEIYFFYGDIYSQDALLRNSKRVHFQVDPDSFISSLQERRIKRRYITELPGDSGGDIKIRSSFFNFVDAAKSKSSEYYFGLRDICNFDYFVFDKASRQEALARYNMLIANELIKNNSSVVFENDLVVILKNDKAGGDCIEEGSF